MGGCVEKGAGHELLPHGPTCHFNFIFRLVRLLRVHDLLLSRCYFDDAKWVVASKKEQVMNSQQAYQPEDKVKVTGRPMWQVSLVASIQRGQKRLNRGRVRVLNAVRAVLTTSAGTGRADVAA